MKKIQVIRGFTLVELIVVITILAVLATIGFLALSGYSQDAKESAVKANARSVQTAISAESAVSGNSPRYYVVHDTGAALSGAVVYVDGNPLTLTGGDWNAANTNYSAGNPDYAKLKMNPEKFKVSALGLPSGASETIAKVVGVDRAAAAYDSKFLSVGAVEFNQVQNGKTRSVSYFQVAWVSPATWAVTVTGNYPASSGSVTGLVKDPKSSSSTGALVDGSASSNSTPAVTTCAANYAKVWGVCIPNSCLAIKTAFPASPDGTYSIDPDGVGGNIAFNVYCDMTTNGGGWTLVFSSNNGTRFNANADMGTDLNSASYTLTLAKKAVLASSASDTMVLYGSNKFVWSGKKLDFTATATYEKICGTTTADSLDGATSKCFGWSPAGIATGWVFGITDSAGFDHHNTSNYMMLNSSCVRHYVYEYNSGGGSGYKYGGCDLTSASTTRLSYFMK